MTDRRDIKLPESLATDLEAHKGESQTWPAFIREDVLPALEGDDSPDLSIDYGEIATRTADEVESRMR